MKYLQIHQIYLSNSLLSSYHIYLWLLWVVVTWWYPKVTKELHLLSFYPQLAISKYYKEIIISYCLLVLHLQFEGLLCWNAKNNAIFVGDDFGIEGSFRVAPTYPSISELEEHNNMRVVVNVLVNVNFVERVVTIDKLGSPNALFGGSLE